MCKNNSALLNNEIMKKILVLITLVLTTSNCSNRENYFTPESAVEANIKYMNEEKFDEVMNTIDKDSPSYSTSKTMIEQIFKLYDLNYKITNMKVIEDNDSEAKIEFTQITTKISGPKFKNNKSTGIHTLKKNGDSWKIYSTQMTDVQYLE